MIVLQHYYTSCVNSETGSAGFQVKAMSPGISPDTQAVILRLISYRIPLKCDEYDVSSHPVALRYYYKNPQEAILLCSQSNGTDENGRPGNFFAHSLVTEPAYFESIPPILYWRSSFWRKKDPGNALIIPPVRHIEVGKVIFDVKGIKQFLAKGNRLEQFHKLMSAVVHYNSTQRRIIIIDTTDNVAQWIAATTFMLPPNCRPLLSFATYHQDPYQSRFIITGTTSDSSFHASPDEYMSYFILNAETGRTSESPPSPYADEIKKAISSDINETGLPSSIGNVLPYFPLPECIDETLDLIALYAGLFKPQHSLLLTSAELQAIDYVLTTIEQEYRQEDLASLQSLNEKLLPSMYQETSQNREDADKEQQRVIALLKKHNVSINTSALYELVYITIAIISGKNLEIALKGPHRVCQVYGNDVFIATLNSSEYLQWLIKSLEGRDIQLTQLVQVWQYLGPSLVPGAYSMQFLLFSLNVGGTLRKEKQFRDEVERFFLTIVHALRGREMEWMRLIVDNHGSLDMTTLEAFYCVFVIPLDLDQRLPYRLLFKTVDDTIDTCELVYEISKTDSENGLRILERWIDHARGQKQYTDSISHLVYAGLDRWLRDTQKLSPQILNKLASQILVSRALVPLPPELENKFINIALANISFSHYTQIDIEMCRKYRAHEGMPPQIYTVMDGLIALSSGELNQQLAERLSTYFMNANSSWTKNAVTEMQSFVSAFLTVCKTDMSHQIMINALSQNHMKDFWEIYWETLTQILVNTTAIMQTLKILEFWFHALPAHFDVPYTVENFFLRLTYQLEKACARDGFREAARSINSRASKDKLEWYPLVQDSFSMRKNIFVRMGKSLLIDIKDAFSASERYIIKKEKKDKEKEENQKKYQERIRNMFQHEKPRQNHRRVIGRVYQWEVRAFFWSVYWESFKHLLLSRETEKVTELLTFWFDDSFEVLELMPHIPQEFFLNLCGVLEKARKERAFWESARLIVKQRHVYRWFPLIQGYFEK